MILLTRLALLLIAALPVTTAFAQSSEAVALSLCPHDRQAMLALDESTFDQHPSRGWRALAQTQECYGVAADLIHEYRELNSPASTTLAWHEGQLRAYLGDTESATALFGQARHDDKDISGWNYYVQASIAFLERDREALLISREELAALPRPDIIFRDSEGNSIEVEWPPNLKVVDRLIRCYDYSYEVAYGRCPVEP